MIIKIKKIIFQILKKIGIKTRSEIFDERFRFYVNNICYRSGVSKTQWGTIEKDLAKKYMMEKDWRGLWIPNKEIMDAIKKG